MATYFPTQFEFNVTKQEQSVLELAIRSQLKSDYHVLSDEICIWTDTHKSAPLLEAYRDIKAGTTFRVDAWQVQLLAEALEHLKKGVCHNKEMRDTWYANPLLKALKSAAK